MNGRVGRPATDAEFVRPPQKMPDDFQKPGCKGCAFARGEEVIGGSVSLPGGWTLNNYGGPEGYLGWLALQPFRHRLAVTDLSNEELRELGPNIAEIQKTLGLYWQETFGDPIERLYIVYFFESQREEPFHLHIHLIPRFKSLEPRLRAWKAPYATKSATFPDRYRKNAPDYWTQVDSLMNHLRNSLQRV